MKQAPRSAPVPINLRLRASLRAKLAEEAKRWGVSLNREIVSRLEASLAGEHHDKLLRFWEAAERRLDSIQGKILAQISTKGTHIVAAIDNLKASVDNAVDVMTSAATEMAAAADFIRNHPPAQNDAELQAMADRLQAAADAEKAAADALHGVDQPAP